MSLPSAQLAALGITLPPVPAPVAAYVPAVRVADLVFTSGQLPFVDGRLRSSGQVGAEVDPEEAYACARVAVLTGLAGGGAGRGGGGARRRGGGDAAIPRPGENAAEGPGPAPA